MDLSPFQPPGAVVDVVDDKYHMESPKINIMLWNINQQPHHFKIPKYACEKYEIDGPKRAHERFKSQGYRLSVRSCIEKVKLIELSKF